MGPLSHQTGPGPAARPTYWFAVAGERGPFDQLAAVLRRHGCRTVRLLDVAPSPRIRAIERLLYDRVITLEELAAGPPDPGTVVGFEWVERMSELIDDGLLDRLDPGTAADLRRRRPFADKAWVAETLTARGFLVAEALDASAVTDAEAIARLGLPLIVKARIGAGSSGVRVAHDPAEVAAAVAELDSSRRSLFFQPRLEGEVRDYAAIIAPDGRVLQDLVVRQYGRLGPLRPLREVVVDPEVIEYARGICAALGIVGPVNLEVMRDSEGRPRLIDLNARTFASMISLRETGVDLPASLCQAIGLRPEAPAAPRPQPGARAAVFPDTVDMYMGIGRPLSAVGELLGRLPRFLHWTSWRYIAHLIALRLLWRLEGKPTTYALPAAE